MSNLPQKNIPHKTSQDFSSLIGIPYETLDCWGIAKEFYKIVFNRNLKAYYENVPETRDLAQSIVYDSMKDFVKVNDRKFGDLLLIRLYGVESHIGIYIDNGQILHTTKHSGCVVDRIARWEKLIVGTYRAKYD